MSLAQRLTATSPAQHGLPCGVARVLADLPAADAKALRDALDMPKGHPLRLSANVISQALRDEGIPLHMKSIETHRKGACRCSKHESGRASNAK
jgi:hypothetical protein